MSTRTTLIVLAIIFIIFAALGAYAYPRLPEWVASHWNAAGQVDGYSSRTSGLLLLPLMVLGITVLLLFVPEIDPLKANIAQFRRDYNSIVVLTAVFMLYLYLLNLLQNLGLHFNMVQWMMPAFGVLFYAIGGLLGKAKRNFFIGIRTPWTLSSDFVWQQTHRRGALLFKIAGAIILLGMLLPQYAMWIMLGACTVAALYTVVYSYWLFQREARQSVQ